jgi:amphi-Trp domain-containing protein
LSVFCWWRLSRTIIIFSIVPKGTVKYTGLSIGDGFFDAKTRTGIYKAIEMHDDTKTYYAKDRKVWRSWLQKNHAQHNHIWLILYKKHVKEPCVSYDAAVEEALCFGWIDGRLKRIDDQKHMVRFSPRRKNSVWSENNKQRVDKMIKQKKMTPVGLALVEAAHKSGQWALAAKREIEAKTPPDLLKALSATKKALSNFKKMAPSYKKMYIGWILDAKREDTRKRRIQKVVELAAANTKPGVDMTRKKKRDIEKEYPTKQFVKKLRRLADCLESNKRFRIQVAKERVYVPADAIINIEHERGSKEEEIEFQLKWKI